MKKLRKQIVLICFSLAVVFHGGGIQARAMESRETYTITFRPGNVGYFSFSSNPEGDRSEMARQVAEQNYSNYTYEVTKNGAIKVQVPGGAPVPAAPSQIQAEEGYIPKDTSFWGPQGGTIVCKNEDYVADYGKIISGVEYTVEYIDQNSKESIAPLYISQGNVGEERSITAPAMIVISDGAIYRLASAGTQSIVLDSDAGNNIISFGYIMEPRGTAVDEILIDGEGNIVTTTETVTTVLEGEGAVEVEVLQEPTEPVAPVAEPELVTVEEEPVPLDNIQLEENTEDLVEIQEEEVPLASMDLQKPNMALIGASVFSAAAALVAILWLAMKRKQIVKVDNKEE